MANDHDDHLTPDVLNRIVTNRASDSEQAIAQAHWKACAACAARLSSYRDAEERLESLRLESSLDSGEVCPEPEEWVRLECGELPDARADALLDHAVTCGRCSDLLRVVLDEQSEANEGKKERLVTELQTARPEAGRSPQVPASQARRWTWAAAAGLVVAASLTSFYVWRTRSVNVEGLLAQAYSAQRPFEYRLPDRGYADVSRQKAGGSSDLDKPRALLEAQAHIVGELSGHPSESSWLRLRGVAEILDLKPDAAVTSLTTAREISPQDPTILFDLGLAYALEGDLKKQDEGAQDYGQAIELFGQVLRLNPKSPMALFNRALVYERFSQYKEAIDDWQKYLQLDNSSPWANEARKHLDALQKKVKRKDDAMKRLGAGPAAFLVAVASGENPALDVYLDRAAIEWLTKPADAVTSRALKELSEMLSARHGDDWLQAVLREQPPGDAGYSELLRLIDGNLAGDASEVLQLAKSVQSFLESRGSKAAALRARFERVYALHRALDPKLCRDEASELLKLLANQKYPWLREQTTLEQAVCTAVLREQGVAIRTIAGVESDAGQRGLEAVRLRARGLRVGIQTNAGDPWIAWTDAPLVLRRSWDDSFPLNRVHQVCFNLSAASGYLDHPIAAYLFARSAVNAIASTPNRLTEADGRLRLAALARSAGFQKEAAIESDNARALFASFPPSEIVNKYLQDGALANAESEILRGNAKAGIASLQQLPEGPEPIFNLDLKRHQLAGLGYLRLHRNDAALAELEAALQLVRARLRALSNQHERLTVLEENAAVYRNMAELLIRRGETKKALEYILELRGWQKEIVSPSPVGIPAVSNDEVWLVYAALSNGFALWRIDHDAGVSFKRLDVDPAHVGHLARRLLSTASQPNSDLSNLRAQGRELYDLMVAPGGQSFASMRSLVVVPDGEAGRIPFNLLCSRQGPFLGEQAAIIIAGRAGTIDLQSLTLTPQAHVLVASVPRIPAVGGRKVPPLPEAEQEMQDITSLFHNNYPLAGDKVTERSIAAHAGAADLFHFSGHGYSNSGNGGLLLAEEGGLPLSSNRIAAMNWSRCRLVVLSACLTGAGEFQGFVNPQSLVGAFLTGGSKSVIASSWSVDAGATRQLFGAFYRFLLNGSPAHVALQRAIRQIKQDSRLAHPYYWGAFQLYQ